MTAQADFTVIVEATCDVTQFREWALDGKSFQQYVQADAAAHALGPAQDAVSQTKGNQDGVSFCGDRVYRIIDE